MLAGKLQTHERMQVAGQKTSRMIRGYFYRRAKDLAEKIQSLWVLLA